MDFTISRRLSSGRLYAYYKKRFWFWDDTRNVWTESHLMSQKYEREHSARAALTPEDFMSDLTRFSPLDEYELDSVMVDALKNAIPCKTVPIEPVKEESECKTNPASSLNPAAAVTMADPAAATASVTATPTTPAAADSCFLPESMTPAFDYTGLDGQTVEDLHLAEEEYLHGKKLAARGLVSMGEGIAIAHDALVANCDRHKNQHSEDTFRAWCLSMGITKDTAYRLLQVSALMDGSSPAQQKVLKELSPSLLYAVAKPSAPEGLVEQVKNGDITTHKEYQELLAQLKAEKERSAAAEAREEEVWKMHEEAKQRAETAENHIQDVEAQRDAALADVQGLTEQNAKLQQSYHDADEGRIAARLQCQKAEGERDRAEERAKDAENQLSGSRQVAEAAKLRADKLQAENAALKKQPITAVIDEEEIDRRAAEKAWGLADARNAELAKDNANLKKQVAALRSRINDDAQADFEQANYCASLMRAAWDNSKASYSRLVGEDLESTFQTICGTLNSIMEEASLLCRQPPDYDGGDRDE